MQITKVHLSKVPLCRLYPYRHRFLIFFIYIYIFARNGLVSFLSPSPLFFSVFLFPPQLFFFLNYYRNFIYLSVIVYSVECPKSSKNPDNIHSFATNTFTLCYSFSPSLSHLLNNNYLNSRCGHARYLVFFLLLIILLIYAIGSSRISLR